MATRILFFGAVKDAAGGAERIVDLPDGISTIDGLIDHIAADDTFLAKTLRGEHVRIAVDQAIVARSAPIKNPREVAFMAPFSGG